MTRIVASAVEWIRLLWNISIHSATFLLGPFKYASLKTRLTRFISRFLFFCYPWERRGRGFSIRDPDRQSFKRDRKIGDKQLIFLFLLPFIRQISFKCWFSPCLLHVYVITNSKLDIGLENITLNSVGKGRGGAWHR